MNLRVFPPLQIFGINISYLYGLIEYTSEAVSQSVMNFCFQGVFFTDSISLLVISLFKFSVSS